MISRETTDMFSGLIEYFDQKNISGSQLYVSVQYICLTKVHRVTSGFGTIVVTF